MDRANHYAEQERDRRVALVLEHGELLKSLAPFRNFTREDMDAMTRAFGPSPQPGKWSPSHRDALLHARSSASFAA
jgi:hypothetical protein